MNEQEILPAGASSAAGQPNRPDDSEWQLGRNGTFEDESAEVKRLKESKEMEEWAKELELDKGGEYLPVAQPAPFVPVAPLSPSSATDLNPNHPSPTSNHAEDYARTIERAKSYFARSVRGIKMPKLDFDFDFNDMNRKSRGVSGPPGGAGGVSAISSGAAMSGSADEGADADQDTDMAASRSQGKFVVDRNSKSKRSKTKMEKVSPRTADNPITSISPSSPSRALQPQPDSAPPANQTPNPKLRLSHHFRLRKLRLSRRHSDSSLHDSPIHKDKIHKPRTLNAPWARRRRSGVGVPTVDEPAHHFLDGTATAEPNRSSLLPLNSPPPHNSLAFSNRSSNPISHFFADMSGSGDSGPDDTSSEEESIVDNCMYGESSDTGSRSESGSPTRNKTAGRRHHQQRLKTLSLNRQHTVDGTDLGDIDTTGSPLSQGKATFDEYDAYVRPHSYQAALVLPPHPSPNAAKLLPKLKNKRSRKRSTTPTDEQPSSFRRARTLSSAPLPIPVPKFPSSDSLMFPSLTTFRKPSPRRTGMGDRDLKDTSPPALYPSSVPEYSFIAPGAGTVEISSSADKSPNTPVTRTSPSQTPQLTSLRRRASRMARRIGDEFAGVADSPGKGFRKVKEMLGGGGRDDGEGERVDDGDIGESGKAKGRRRRRVRSGSVPASVRGESRRDEFPFPDFSGLGITKPGILQESGNHEQELDDSYSSTVPGDPPLGLRSATRHKRGASESPLKLQKQQHGGMHSLGGIPAPGPASSSTPFASAMYSSIPTKPPKASKTPKPVKAPTKHRSKSATGINFSSLSNLQPPLTRPGRPVRATLSSLSASAAAFSEESDWDAAVTPGGTRSGGANPRTRFSADWDRMSLNNGGKGAWIAGVGDVDLGTVGAGSSRGRGRVGAAAVLRDAARSAAGRRRATVGGGVGFEERGMPDRTDGNGGRDRGDGTGRLEVPGMVRDALLGAGLLVVGLYGSAYGAYRRKKREWGEGREAGSGGRDARDGRDGVDGAGQAV
ncbi:hypothetical protein HDU93_000902 [Gonapodya sp. JEL0774]|nr:hypothetical protein HDU93_000902 [Gonapodya sp. JEL0774]